MIQPAPTLIFDGDCGFCTSAANFVVRRSVPPVTAIAWQLSDVSEFGLTTAETQQRVYLVMTDPESGVRLFGGHLAFAQLLRLQQNRGLSLLGRVLSWVPFRWLGALGYTLVARYRHRLPGGTPACKMAATDHN